MGSILGRNSRRSTNNVRQPTNNGSESMGSILGGNLESLPNNNDKISNYDLGQFLGLLSLINKDSNNTTSDSNNVNNTNNQNFSNTVNTNQNMSSTPLNEAYNNNMSNLVFGPNGEQILATPQNTVEGIPRKKIPPGQEDLYILKSEIVPPVCPACPPVIVDEKLLKKKDCQPCPPCARCPEPTFECKKVPNYNSSNVNQGMPKPLLNDFSTFAM